MDVIISLNIPQKYSQDLVDALNGRHKVPMIPDPDWEGNPVTDEQPMVPLYSPVDWAKRVVVNFLVDELYKWEKTTADNQAVSEVNKKQDIAS